MGKTKENIKKVVSVVIPIYNAVHYLEQCLDSVLGQSLNGIDVILVDDGSTDGSGEICDQYADLDSRVHVIHQKNCGTVVARRVGIEAAKGKYVGFVDADDTIDAEMFSFMLDVIERTRSDFIQIEANTEKSFQSVDEVIEIDETNRQQVINECLYGQLGISSNLWSKLFRVELLNDVFRKIPEEQYYGEDLLCLLHYLNASNRVYLCSQEFYHYRTLEGTVSRKSWEQMCIESTGLYLEIRKTLESYGEWEECKEGAKSYYRALLIDYLKKGFQDKDAVERYRFTKIPQIQGRRVVLYGAGKVGSDFYKQIVCNEKKQILAWVDKNPVGTVVQSPECLRELEYDLILIAVLKKEVADEIRDFLLRSGLCDDSDKIIWKEPERLW